MRTLLLFMIAALLLHNQLHGANALTLALLGEPPALLDLISVELTRDDSFALLARAEIDQILREHQLTASDSSQLARLFPHADIIAVFTAAWNQKSGRIVVINAKNGFRLADQSWAYDAPAAQINSLAQIIRDGASKARKPGSQLIAINQYRLVSIDWQQHDAIKTWFNQFETALTRHPDIQLLERERLDAVGEERQLSAAQFALTPSARILRLEFEPGDKSTHVHLTLYCHDLQGREITRLRQLDILALTPDATAQFVSKLADTLAAQAPTGAVTAAAAREAAEFYAAYQQNLDRNDALKYIQAAVALNPHHEEYRHAEIVAMANIRSYRSRQDQLDKTRQTYARIQRFQNDFPHSQRPFFPVEARRKWHLFAFGLEESMESYRHRGQMDLAADCERVLQQYGAFFAEIRPAVHADIRRQPQYQFDLSDGLGSSSEIKHVITFLREAFFASPLYTDHDQRISDFFAVYLEILHALERSYRLDPTKPTPTPKAFMPWDKLLQDSTVRNATRSFLNQDQTLIAFLEECSLPDGKALALDWRTVQILLNTQHQPKNIKKNYHDYFAALAALSPGCFADLTKWQNRLIEAPFSIINEECFAVPPNFAYTCLHEYLGNSTLDVLILLENAARGNGHDDLLPPLLVAMDAIHALNYRYLTEYKVANLFRDLAFVIWEKTPAESRRTIEQFRPSPRQDQLLRAVNAQVVFDYGGFHDAMAAPKPMVCKNACQDSDGVILLLGQANGQQGQGAMVARIAADGRFSKLIDIEEFARKTHLYFGDDDTSFIHLLCDSQFILVASNNGLGVFNRQSGALLSTFHIPLQPNNTCLALVGDRLFVQTTNALHAMNLQGEERRLYFSQERLEPQHDLDRGGLASDLVTCANGELFFLVSHEVPKQRYAKQEIWQLKTADDSPQLFLALPPKRCYALAPGNQAPLVLALDRQSNVIYQLDHATRTLQPLAEAPKKGKYSSPRHMRNTFSDVNIPYPYPYVLHEHFLWAGGHYPACINLAAPEQSPLIWLPRTTWAFPLRNDVLFLRRDMWFRLRLRDNASPKPQP
ncbi:hypothetical protein [Oligosphaera ethanolica]|uniref:Uncharacterized protein n=1 Tax=Oligosphaera ethanolica TaxID=760260 RepID=A0AAE4AML1_9BACT|nr:hypothetical protein [Oligosphaera ethanolica]MDQ0288611.1 hypothetical protein [Oligosphaera ethanolica]